MRSVHDPAPARIGTRQHHRAALDATNRLAGFRNRVRVSSAAYCATWSGPAGRAADRPGHRRAVWRRGSGGHAPPAAHVNSRGWPDRSRSNSRRPSRRPAVAADWLTRLSSRAFEHRRAVLAEQPFDCRIRFVTVLSWTGVERGTAQAATGSGRPTRACRRRAPARSSHRPPELLAGASVESLTRVGGGWRACYPQFRPRARAPEADPGRKCDEGLTRSGQIPSPAEKARCRGGVG
jgi:hypothetical protein